MLIPDAAALSLIPRPAYRELVIAGAPEAFGRVVEMSDDKRTAYVVWRATPGAYQFRPDAAMTDTCYVIRGRALVRCMSQPEAHLLPGTLYQFPREPFELEIVEEFVKVSFLYRAEGLSCEVEPA